MYILVSASEKGSSPYIHIHVHIHIHIHIIQESASDVTRRIDSNMTRTGFSHL